MIFLLGSQSILMLQISADIFYISIYQICCWYCAAVGLLCSFRVPGDLLSRGTWCGSTRTPWEPWTGCQWPPWPWHSAVPGHRTQGEHRRLKTSQMLWPRLLLLLCRLMSWFTLCSDFLEMLLFSTKKWFIAANSWAWTQKGKQEMVCEVVQFVNKTELKRRWILKKL